MADQPHAFANHLFLSDIHLEGFSKARNRRIQESLIKLIDFCEKKQYKIYILGDLFDYWMEYPDHTPDIGKKVLKRFEHYNRHFGPTLFITGNHDNWTRDYLPGIGFDIEQDYRELSLQGQKLLLLHGDGLKQGEHAKRPRMHRLLRNPRFIKLYQRLLPPSAGLKIMKYFSRVNRFLERWGSDEKVLNKWAEKQLKENDYAIIISGHDHMPRKLNFSFGTYLNLGTFYQHRTLAVYNNGCPELVVWNDVKGELTATDSESVIDE
ncbi:MAG: UDP-2,3-diacylglucosamine diphosphatase [Balneolaceae bacterium]|nr:UDP-2,3-diacylglucosamine diphosphatase [Balneolaceae bacterium]